MPRPIHLAAAWLCCTLISPVVFAFAAPPTEPAWNAKTMPLSKWRWQLDGSLREQHLAQRSKSPVISDVRVRWTDDAKKLDGISDEERWELSKLKVDRLTDGLSHETLRGLQVTIDVIEAWRPYRALNVVLFALPGPGPAMVTQGGVHAVITIRQADTEAPILTFDCREYAGFLAFAGAFTRVSHVRTAMQTCANNAIGLFKEGQLPAPLAMAKSASPAALRDQQTMLITDLGGGDGDAD